MITNFLDYVKENQKTFDEFPFTDVDALVLSWLSYIYYPKEKKILSYEGIKLPELLKKEYFDLLFKYPVEKDNNYSLFLECCFSKRFRDIKLCHFEERFDKSSTVQFAAITFVINDDLLFCSFRGTDSTINGWSENFNMAFSKAIPSQKAGQKYLLDTANNLPGKIIAGGHSKGGNIAVYSAAMNMNTLEDRIIKIYSFDGPGFNEAILNNENFTKARNRIRKIIPQSSLISTILNQEAEVAVITSNNKGVKQHNPYSWEVVDLHFCYKYDVTTESKYYAATINGLLAKLTDSEKKELFHIVVSTCYNSGVNKLEDIGPTIKNNLPKITKSLSKLNQQEIELLWQTFKELLAISFDTIPTIFNILK